MNLSLNEIEAMSRKATRGAGYPWGLAEEAGKVTRWLCTHGQDGCGALAALLLQTKGGALGQATPVVSGEAWAAHGGALCPLTIGSAAADRAPKLPRDGILLGPVAQPLLLVPFAAQIARKMATIVTLACNGCVFTTDGDRFDIHGAPVPDAGRVTMRFGGTVVGQPPKHERAFPTPEAWQTLTEFAGRTYAPATDDSRNKGAGPDDSDND